MFELHSRWLGPGVEVTICETINEGRANDGESELHRGKFAKVGRRRHLPNCRRRRAEASRSDLDRVNDKLPPSQWPEEILNFISLLIRLPTRSRVRYLRSGHLNRVVPACETVVKTCSLIVEFCISVPRIIPRGHTAVDRA